MQIAMKTVASCILAAFILCGTVQASEIAAIGDSMMKAVGRAVRRQYGARNISTEVFTSIGSGLARMDLLDWHAEAATLMATHRPSLVFVMLGANDNQAMQIGGSILAFGSAEWNSEYGRRAGKLMDTLLDGGAKRVIWIGLPVMRERKLDADVRVIEQVVIEQVKQRNKVLYFPTSEIFSPSPDIRLTSYWPTECLLTFVRGTGFILTGMARSTLQGSFSKNFQHRISGP